MPLVRIDLRKGTTPEYRKAIADGVHHALASALAAPPDDRFQVIAEHDPTNLIYDANYLGVPRTDSVVFIQVTLSAGRKLAQKRAFYQQVVENLAKAPGLRREDVVINLVETAWENWSFGNGVAHYTLD